MRVLVACEYSGTVRDAFITRGHDAMSCDLLPTDVPGPHHCGSIFDVLNDDWDLMIGHPPCTYLTNSGVSWLHKDCTRWGKLDDGASFFLALWNADIPMIALENPIMHRYARERVGGARPTQIIQPWMFGHPESKATCLWLKNLPPLLGTCDARQAMAALPKRERQRLHYLPPSKDRWKLRSTTYAGIAAAMAQQWG